MPEAIAVLSPSTPSPADLLSPSTWGQPWRNPFCAVCKHPMTPDGARIEGPPYCVHDCHDLPEGEGR